MTSMLATLFTVAALLSAIDTAIAGDPGYGCDLTTTPPGRQCCVPSAPNCGSLQRCSSKFRVPSNELGCYGGRFQASGPLQQWGWAGYQAGRQLLPWVPMTANVMDFGAKGDGVSDDTAAVQAALDAVFEGALYFPSGKYVLKKKLSIDKSVVVRGAGIKKTTLIFPRSLQDAYGQTWGGWIQFNGADYTTDTNVLATLTRDTQRGSPVLWPSSTNAISQNDWIMLTADSPSDGSLIDALNLNTPGYTGGVPLDVVNARRLLRFSAQVASVNDDGSITLNRPVPYSLPTRFNLELHSWTMTRINCGVEALTIRFPANTPFLGEYKEEGYNAIFMNQLAHGWVNQVAIENSDTAIRVDASVFMTIANITISGTRSSGDYAGSRGIWLRNTHDTLVASFYIRNPTKRDVLLTNLATGNVIANGAGADLAMDAYGGSVYGNLYTSMNIGAGTRPFGEAANKGHATAAYNTYWNIFSKGRDGASLTAPGRSYGPNLAFAGIMDGNSINAGGNAAQSWWVDGGAAAQIFPTDLSAFQTKLAGPVTTDPSTGIRGGEYSCNKDGSKCCTGSRISKICKACQEGARPTSSLWGCSGEQYDSSGNMPWDWSYAGYQAGELPIPDVPVVANVQDYGAVGDGITDDTNAFISCIAAISSNPGAIFVPPGKYILTQRIYFNYTSLVLRGAGIKSTTLYFPYSLTQLYGNQPRDGGNSQYSHADGFIYMQGWDQMRGSSLISHIISDINQGESIIQLAAPFTGYASMQPGDWVRVVVNDTWDSQVLRELYSGLSLEDAAVTTSSWRGTPYMMRLCARVLSVDYGTGTVRLSRALPYNVKAAWGPQLHKFIPKTQNNGIEGLTIEFPLTRYAGHLNEAGYNAIQLVQLQNSWVRNVRVLNADTAISTYGMTFVTIRDIEVANTGERADSNGYQGHRGVWMDHGNDNLITKFKITSDLFHYISVQGTEAGCVIADGTGVDMNMDHHRSAPFATLWTNLTLGLGSRPFDSSGAPNNGLNSGAYATFWNIRSRLGLLLPHGILPGDEEGLRTARLMLGPNLNFVDINSLDQRVNDQGWVVELVRNVRPANLYRGMADARLGAGWVSAYGPRMVKS